MRRAVSLETGNDLDRAGCCELLRQAADDSRQAPDGGWAVRTDDREYRRGACRSRRVGSAVSAAFVLGTCHPPRKPTRSRLDTTRRDRSRGDIAASRLTRVFVWDRRRKSGASRGQLGLRLSLRSGEPRGARSYGPWNPLNLVMTSPSHLEDLQENWEALAQDDPLWAVLTDDTLRGGRWDADAFLASGEREIETMWARLNRFAQPDTTLPALDFGCGVGRLTQALAKRMNGCVGVDISPTMIDTAQRLNRMGSAVSFTVNPDEGLPFDDDAFGLVYSSIVLQHMRPEYALGYISEFLRVTAPGGLVVIGVPERHVELRGRQRVVDMLRAQMHAVRRSLAVGTRLRQRRLKIAASPEPAGTMEMHAVPEDEIRLLAGRRGADVLDVALINSAERDYNGALRYLDSAPALGWISKQYTLAPQSRPQRRIHSVVGQPRFAL